MSEARKEDFKKGLGDAREQTDRRWRHAKELRKNARNDRLQRVRAKAPECDRVLPHDEQVLADFISGKTVQAFLQREDEQLMRMALDVLYKCSQRTDMSYRNALCDPEVLCRLGELARTRDAVLVERSLTICINVSALDADVPRVIEYVNPGQLCASLLGNMEEVPVLLRRDAAWLTASIVTTHWKCRDHMVQHNVPSLLCSNVRHCLRSDPTHPFITDDEVILLERCVYAASLMFKGANLPAWPVVAECWELMEYCLQVESGSHEIKLDATDAVCRVFERGDRAYMERMLRNPAVMQRWLMLSAHQEVGIVANVAAGLSHLAQYDDKIVEYEDGSPMETPCVPKVPALLQAGMLNALELLVHHPASKVRESTLWAIQELYYDDFEFLKAVMSDTGNNLFERVMLPSCAPGTVARVRNVALRGVICAGLVALDEGLAGKAVLTALVDTYDILRVLKPAFDDNVGPRMFAEAVQLVNVLLHARPGYAMRVLEEEEMFRMINGRYNDLAEMSEATEEHCKSILARDPGEGGGGMEEEDDDEALDPSIMQPFYPLQHNPQSPWNQAPAMAAHQMAAWGLQQQQQQQFNF